MISDRFLLSLDKPRLVFFTGAGLSAESGIPTFRDSGGLWENHDVDKVCNIHKFKDNYELVHKFYNDRRQALALVQPNAAHRMIADVQAKFGTDRVLHVTANVDDLTDRCGAESIKLHGDILQVLEPFSPNERDVKVLQIGHKEYTPKDGVLAKPNVVFFNECYRYENQRKVPIYDERDLILSSLNENDIGIVIGSGDSVIMWSYLLGMYTPAYTVNVNPVQGENDHMFMENIIDTAVNSVPKLLTLIEEKMK